MIEMFLYVLVCSLPISDPQKDCRQVEVYEVQGAVQCQMDRILVTQVWRREVERLYGRGYAVFTGCDGPDLDDWLKENENGS